MSKQKAAKMETLDATRLLRSAMHRRGISGKQLAILLGEERDGHGRAVLAKIARGTFSFAWGIGALRAMNVSSLDLTPVGTIEVEATGKLPAGK